MGEIRLIIVVCIMRSLLLLSLVLLAGCAEADAEKVRRVGEKTYDRAASLAVQTWDELGRTLLDAAPKTEPVPDVKARVEYRLKWDRELADVKIDVVMDAEDVVLVGKLKSETLKERALRLASDTFGVIKVKDELQLEKPPESPPTGTAPPLGSPQE